MKKIILPKKIFVTGTDTEIGKTFVSSVLVKKMNASYWKIIQTGDDSDKDVVKNITGFEKEKFIDEAYKLKNPLSPYAASVRENKNIEIKNILKRFNEIKDKRLVCEGAGGVLVPIKKDYFMSDLIKDLNLSCVVAARSGLGTINHSLLTIEHLKNKGIDISCIILNGELNYDNEKIIEEITEIPVLSFGNFDFSKKNDFGKLFEDKFRFEIN
ncbi:MAG: dethiobiotin synthase [Desulfobacteraceae bacterium]|nr:dethiobiotin synthase [Desulfobacteraceae bacterium]